MATITQRGKSYVLNWSEGGQQFRRSLGSVSRETARQVCQIKETELLTGIRVGSAPRQSIPLQDFTPDYLAWHASEYPDSHTRARQIVRDHVLPTFGAMMLDAINPRDVEQWKAARLAAGAAPGTVGKELRTLKAVLNQAVKWEVIGQHRIAPVKPPREVNDAPPPYYSGDELAAIYEISGYGAVWRFMANTGLRRAEMMAAKRQDIVSGQLRVLSTALSRTKSSRWRLVPLSPGALLALKDLGADYIAPRINPRSMSRAFKRDAQAAGLGGSIHWLRHTFCSHLVMSGVDLPTVQKLAGHASFITTMNYSHLAAAHLAAAVSGLEL